MSSLPPLIGQETPKRPPFAAAEMGSGYCSSVPGKDVRGEVRIAMLLIGRRLLFQAIVGTYVAPSSSEHTLKPATWQSGSFQWSVSVAINACHGRSPHRWLHGSCCREVQVVTETMPLRKSAYKSIRSPGRGCWNFHTQARRSPWFSMGKVN